MFSLFTAHAIACMENKNYEGFSMCDQQNRKFESVQKDI